MYIIFSIQCLICINTTHPILVFTPANHPTVPLQYSAIRSLVDSNVNQLITPLIPFIYIHTGVISYINFIITISYNIFIFKTFNTFSPLLLIFEHVEPLTVHQT